MNYCWRMTQSVKFPGEGKETFLCHHARTGLRSRTIVGATLGSPNRRQVKPALPEASKRREVLGRLERPAMERPAACIIASPIRRRACVNDKRPQKPCASTTV